MEEGGGETYEGGWKVFSVGGLLVRVLPPPSSTPLCRSLVFVRIQDLLYDFFVCAISPGNAKE